MMSGPILSYEEFCREKMGRRNSILFAHGLFGSKKNWLTTAKLLSKKLDRHVIVVDLRNHGSSFWSNIHDYPSLAGDLINLITYLGCKFDLVGHSMGGKAIMSACLSNPQKFDRVVVIDIGPVSYHSTEFLEYILAMKELDLDKINSRNEADSLLAIKVPDQIIRSFLLQNLVRKKDKNYEWIINLGSLRKNINLIGGFPVYKAQFSGPALFLKGQKSSYVSKKCLIDINKYFPSFTIQEINEAGHWPHFEQPRLFQEKLINFLD
tara:strand:+ start:1437 stop:2231 length:795 start_codon:yes stop_codon:yes gene_type:complete